MLLFMASPKRNVFLFLFFLLHVYFLFYTSLAILLPCSLRASTFVLCTFLAGPLLNAFLATRTMTYIANSLWNRSNGHWKNLGVNCEKALSRMLLYACDLSLWAWSLSLLMRLVWCNRVMGNQHPPVHHQLDARYYSVVDEPQLS